MDFETIRFFKSIETGNCRWIKPQANLTKLIITKELEKS